MNIYNTSAQTFVIIHTLEYVQKCALNPRLLIPATKAKKLQLNILNKNIFLAEFATVPGVGGKN